MPVEDHTQVPVGTRDLESLLLEPFKSKNGKIRFLNYVGRGTAGHVFKVRIGGQQYALKLFKFDHPELNPSRLTGTYRKYFFDTFFIECRANGSLIQQGLNGQITPTCYGWIPISTRIETYLAQTFEIPFLWDRSPSVDNQKVRGILFEWVDGQPLSKVPISSDIADQVRAKLNALHRAGIVHGDLAASNILVETQTQGTNPKVHLIDLSASITLPHIKFSPEQLATIQEEEVHDLEIGFALLSRIPINRGLCVSRISPDDVGPEAKFMQYLWAPPQPTSWQPPAIQPDSDV